MQDGIKNSITRTIIILMFFLLCLPCSAKREIKLTLDIPLNEIENKFSSTQSGICFITTVKKASVSFEAKVVKKYHSNNFSSFQHVILTSPLFSTSFPEKKVSKIIPIYILHEQYLI